MREEKVEVYTFGELSPEVQEEVLNHNRELAYHDDWYEWIIEDFIENKPKWLEVDTKKIHWDNYFNMDMDNSISVDIQQYVEETYPDKWRLMEPYQLMIQLQRNGSIDIDMLEYPTVDEEYIQDEIINGCGEELSDNYLTRITSKLKDKIERILENIHDEVESEVDKLSKELSSAYDDLGSDEQVKEMIECNEWEFYKDGRRYLE